MDYKKIIAERIKENVELDLNTIEGLIEIPPKSDMGDYAFPCFQLAKAFRKAPNMIAEELSSKINNEGRSEEHTSELQSRQYLVCRLLLEKKKTYAVPVRD